MNVSGNHEPTRPPWSDASKKLLLWTRGFALQIASAVLLAIGAVLAEQASRTVDANGVSSLGGPWLRIADFLGYSSIVVCLLLVVPYALALAQAYRVMKSLHELGLSKSGGWPTVTIGIVFPPLGVLDLIRILHRAGKQARVWEADGSGKQRS